MESPKRTLILVGILALMAVALVIIWNRSSHPSKPAPTGGQFYYTGPMRNKGNPQLFTTDEGKVVQPPPGVSVQPTHAPPPLIPDETQGKPDAKAKSSR